MKKKSSYKVFGLLLCFMLCMALMPGMTAMAKTTAEGPGWYFDDDGTLYLTGEIENESNMWMYRPPFNVQDVNEQWLMPQIKKLVAKEGSYATNGIYLFGGMPNLETIDLDKFDFSQLSYMESFFAYDKSLTEIEIDGWNIPNVSMMNMMFAGCENLTSVHIKNLDCPRLHNIEAMFSLCKNLTDVTIENINAPQLGTLSNMFKECSSLTSVDLSWLENSEIHLMDSMFSGCSSLTSLDLSQIEAPYLYRMESMLQGCSSLTSLDVSKLSLLQLMDGGAKNVLEGCTALQEIHASEAFVKATASNLIGLSTDWFNKEDATPYPSVEALEKISGVVTLFKHNKHVYDRYVSVENGNHKIVCHYCDEILKGHESDTCEGGEATCSSKAKCSKCNGEYGERKPHAMGTSWVSDGTNHWKACTVCGDKQDVQSHAGSTATCTQKAKCTVCNKEYGALKAHTYGNEWKTNANNHWHVCTTCGKIKDGAAHTMQTVTVTKATLTDDGKKVTKCSVCSKVTNTAAISRIKSIKLANNSYVYDGKAKKPSVSVTDGNGKVIAKTNYTVTYAKGRKTVGQYSVKITFKGNYSGSKVLTFVIKPKATTIKSVIAAKKGFTVKWAKQTKQVDGYELQYATNSKFTANLKKVTIDKNSNVSKKISKLKAKKTYYVRVRTYKKVNGKKYCSAWTKTEKVKTK